jgi:type II secretory pathway pseudopilin PulG
MTGKQPQVRTEKQPQVRTEKQPQVRTGNRRGMTLVEILFTFCLLSMVFVLTLNVLPAAMMSERQTEHRTAALALVQNVFDQCSAMSFKNLTDGTHMVSSNDPIGVALASLPNHTDDGTQFTTRVVISAVPGASAPPRNLLCQVVVYVDWSEGYNKNKEIVEEMQISCINR